MRRLVYVTVAVVLIANPTVREHARPYFQRALAPVYEWSVRSRVGEIARRLEAERVAGGSVPTNAELAQFLRRTYRTPTATVDPWEMPFFLVEGPHGVQVGSAGRDRRPRTADDILSPVLRIARR